MGKKHNDHIQHDPFDPEILQINALYAESEEEDEGDEFLERKKSPLFKVLALILALIVMLYVLGNVYSFLSWPSLDFLDKSRELKQESMIKELEKAVVNIKVIESNLPGERRGTGFNIVAEGVIVTNRHIVEDASMIIVSFLDGRTYHAQSWEEHPLTDLAVVTLDAKKLPTVPVKTDSLPQVGESVTIIGNPLGFQRIANKGQVSNYGHIDDKLGYVMEITAPIHQGSSGSPVFNEEGEAVAVVFATTPTHNDNETKGLAIPIIQLQEIYNVEL